jgi:F0F1-type ATP synthase assembly protein I
VSDVSSNGDERLDPIAAVALLRRHAISNGVPTEIGVAIGVLLDHLANTEMVVSLIRGGYESAFRHAPEPAIVDARKKRT